MKRHRLAALCVAASVMLACVAHARQPNLADLLRIGHGLAEATKPPGPVTDLDIQRRAFGVVEAPTLERELTALLEELRAVVPGNAPAARIYVTPDPAFGAHASAEGSLFIAYGMLMSVESRDELAALLAHEYGHIVLGHTPPSLAEQMSKSVGDVAGLYMDYRYGSVGNGQLEDLRSKDRRRVLSFGVAMSTVQDGLIPSHSRRHEREADLFAADTLVAAGYNPTAMADLMSRVGTWEDARQAALKQRELALVDIEALAREAAQKGDVEGTLNSVISGGLHNLIAAGGNAFTRGFNKLRRRHDTPEARLDLIVEHLAETHPDAPRPALRPIPWSDDPSVAELFAGIARTHELLDALGEEKPGELDELATSVARSRAAATPLARYALMQLRGSRDSKGEIVEKLVREISRPDSLFQANVLALELLEEYGSPEQKLAALALSRESLGDPNELVPYAVRFYRQAGNETRATLELSRCMAAAGPVRESCQATMH